MTNTAELADYQWLTGQEAAEMLAELAGRNEPLHAAVARLRRTLSASRAHLLLEQAELRQRAAAKFERAGDMFFTRLGLEQATDQWVASHKVRRFADRGPVADLCCGIGGDLLALAASGPSIGVDRDEVAACFAAANARIAGVSEKASLTIGEIDGIDACVFAAWHIDPDRRPTGHRTTALEWSSPSVESVERLLAANPNAAIKLAPAADVPAIWTDRCELEWISRDRQCRQLVAWRGTLARQPGVHCATVLSTDGNVARIVTGRPDQPKTYTPQLGRFLFEPDPAVLAAHLAGVLAAQHGLFAVSAGIAYLTGPSAIDDPALACFEVCEVLPLNLRQVAGHLREQNIGRLEIKKRGVEHDPAAVRKQLQLHGDNSATLFLTKLGGKHVAIVARRIEHSPVFSSLTPDS
jgi:THUMP domain-like